MALYKRIIALGLPRLGCDVARVSCCRWLVSQQYHHKRDDIRDRCSGSHEPLRLQALVPSSYVHETLLAVYDYVDRFISRRTPRLLKHVIKALAQLSTGIAFTPQELLLASIILLRIQNGAYTKPPPELAKVEANWRYRPDRIMVENGSAIVPPYATPEEDMVELSLVRRMAQYSLAAYAPNLEVVCEALHLCPSDVITTNWVADPESLVPAFFIAVDKDLEAIVVSIRGTYSFSDTMVNFTAAPEEFSGGTAHGGMLTTAKELLNHLKTRINFTQVLREHPTYSLLLTGHSMGGAVAAFMAMMLKVEYPHTRAHIVCPPSCMSNSLAESCSSYVHSYLNGDDVVPRFHHDAIQRLRTALEDVDVQREVLSSLHLDEYITPKVVARLLEPLEAFWNIVKSTVAAAWRWADLLSIPVRSWSTAVSTFYEHAKEAMLDLVVGQAHYLRSVRSRFGADTAEIVNKAAKREETHHITKTLVISDAFEFAQAELDHLALTATQAGTWSPFVSTDDEFPPSYYTSKSRDFSSGLSGSTEHLPSRSSAERLAILGTSMAWTAALRNHSASPRSEQAEKAQQLTMISDFIVEPGSIVENPADPYGSENAEDEGIAAREFNTEETLLFGMATYMASDTPVVTATDRATQASGYDEEERPAATPTNVMLEELNGVPAEFAKSVQYHPPGKLWFMAYPTGYQRRLLRKVASPRRFQSELQQLDSSMANEAGLRPGRETVQQDDEEDEPFDANAYRGSLINSNQRWRHMAGDGLGVEQITRSDTAADAESQADGVPLRWQRVPGYAGPVFLRLQPQQATYDADAAEGSATTAGSNPLMEILDPYELETPWPSLSIDSAALEAQNEDEHAKACVADAVNVDSMINKSQLGTASTIVSSASSSSSSILDDGRYFGHVMLSPHMFTDHLASSFLAELDCWIHHLQRERHAAELISGNLEEWRDKHYTVGAGVSYIQEWEEDATDVDLSFGYSSEALVEADIDSNSKPTGTSIKARTPSLGDNREG
jgi:hypothetical protein